MKKFLTFIFIILIILPLLFYLNPFARIRKQTQYDPSPETTELLRKLDKKYNLKMSIGDVIGNIWYYRDIDNRKKVKSEHFELFLNIKDDKVDDIKKVYQYVDDFRTEFNQKKYFDSITVKLVNDSIPYKPGPVIYKSKM
ncbi:hypothetical protein ATE49_03625 [Elizabethkingia miricola]|uniref:Uncharacterized protein n=1 Tax=Elizabethkingia miricola TaxID=172045 RepID=A0ABY3NE55_ELIMR|nr:MULTISPECIES: hypothetical protein [Elizabethkingia]OBS12915.1 hypothetical protein ATE49_03625 [Elizabethkingia miricola]TYO89017.1 hypothetical protein LX74_03105 [Elizabethkingia miricola]